MALSEHAEIINVVAKKILKPCGLISKGQSRVWYDDHGWYTAQIEFQPFSGRVGTCINVGVAFHWYYKDHIGFSMGYRESDFVYYENEKQFTPEVGKLTLLALKKILYYRKALENISSAKETILKHKFTSDSLWGNYHRGVICGLDHDIENAIKFFDMVLEIDHRVPWADELKSRIHLFKILLPDSSQFREQVIKTIIETRAANKLDTLEISLE
ncbi:MAG TPA: hypothetical protein VFJ43_09605 [Bacteroidia bacterium]|nr:hypothetical protein [Bacteroidia bacterium]